MRLRGIKTGISSAVMTFALFVHITNVQAGSFLVEVKEQGMDTSFGLPQSIEDLKSGVVKITAEADGRRRLGTGFIVKIQEDAAYIVTASHVVEGGTPTVHFYPNPEKKYHGIVQAMDGGNPKGLALIIVQGNLPKEIHHLSLQSNITVKGGEEITLIGFPLNMGVQWGVVQGNIVGQKGLDLIISGMVVQEGNSGGPILLKGKVVGVLTEGQNFFGYGVPSSLTLLALKGWGIQLAEKSQSIAQVSPFENKRTVEKSGAVPTSIIAQDGTLMVLIPGGPFTMGSRGGENNANEQPMHVVDVPSFYIDQYEVTVKRYRRFLKQTDRNHPKYWEKMKLGRDAEKPVVGSDLE